MKTLRITFKTFATALVIIFVTGCEDYLDTPVQVETTIDNFYQSPDDAEYAVTAAYSVLKYAGLGNNLQKGRIHSFGQILGDIMSDDAWLGGKTYEDGNEFKELEQFRYRTTHGPLLDIWEDIWKGVYRANLVINKVPTTDFAGMEEPNGYNLKQRYLAEARWLRAYFYFRLVTMYQNGPLITDLLPPEDFYSIGMAGEDAIYDQIIEDLKYCLEIPSANASNNNPRLPKKIEYDDTDLGKITVAGAKGLLAKVYMYQNENWDEVKRLTKEIIDDPQYDLNTSYSKIFLPESENNSESVIEFQYTESNNGERSSFNNGNILFVMHAGRNNSMWVNELNAPRTGWAWNQPSHNLYEAFESGDPRQDFTFLEAGEPYPHDTSVIVVRHDSEEGPNTFAPGYISEKMMLPPSVMPIDQTDSPFNIRYMRTSDVYLMYAEACYHKGDEPQARWAVNQVRARARREADLTNFPDALADISESTTGDALLDAIWHERRVELAMEGHRFWDLVRQSKIRQGRIAEVINSFYANPVNADGNPMISLNNPFVTGVHEYLQIPKSETDLTGGSISK
ncbi:MAG: RagB/SusD family nutrient uptake outer membrane protein [Bacteroidetes bacterium]|nr:RagB/SusD family nutrient uptake outer membrane protein [Bacteroidota bacterium]